MIIKFNLYTESLKDKLKGKSEEEVLDKLMKLDPNEMLFQSSIHGYKYGIDKAMELGADMEYDDYAALGNSIVYDHPEIFYYLYELSVNDIKRRNRLGKLMNPLSTNIRELNEDIIDTIINNSNYKNYLDMVRFLLNDKYTDVNKVLRSQTSMCILRGQNKIIQIFCEFVDESNIEYLDYYLKIAHGQSKYNIMETLQKRKDGLLQHKVNESPDLYYDPKYSTNIEWNSTEYLPVTFGWDKGILHTKRVTKENQNRAGHYNLHSGIGVHVPREDWTNPGRLWLKTKVISFWEYPSAKKLPILLKEIQNKLSIDILNDSEWRIEIYGDPNDKNNPSRELVSIKDYKGSIPIPEDERIRHHINSPMNKKQTIVPDNMGSKKQKPLDIRQLMYAESVKLKESLKDKLKGKSEEEINNNIENIINDIVHELLNRKFFFDYDKAYKFIKDKYTEEILYTIDQVSSDDNHQRIDYSDVASIIVMSFEEDYLAKIHSSLHN